MSAHISENTKHAADALSIMTVVATLAEWLPAVAALASLIWSVIRIWETKTVQSWRLPQTVW
jgi:hypothetical protein